MKTLWELECALRHGLAPGESREYRVSVSGIVPRYRVSVYETVSGTEQWRGAGEGPSLASAVDAALIEYRSRRKK